MKRLFDVVVSLSGLVVCAPLLFIISCIIKIESPGPVFYRCRRVGRYGRPFGMFKFRTMVAFADKVDCSLCPSGDVRVTMFGGILRRTKLNELPNLLNVLAGDMSMVGPRPEDPKFVTYYRDKWQTVLSVRPGVVGPNQLAHRNEEDLLAGSGDSERFYVENLLPGKLERDIEYVRTRSTLWDVLILVQGVYVTVFKGGSWLRPFRNKRLLLVVSVDIMCAALAYLAANLLRFESVPNERYIWISLAFVVLVNPAVFLSTGMYRRSVRFFSLPDLLVLMRTCAVAGCGLVVISYFFLIQSGHSRAVYLLYPMILLMMTASVRVAGRMLLEHKELGHHESGPELPMLIYGAGRQGVETARRFRFQPGFRVVGFVDDDECIRGQHIAGVPVLGTGADLPVLKVLHDIEYLVIAFSSPSLDTLAQLGRRCEAGGMKVLFATVNGWDSPSPEGKRETHVAAC